MTLDAAMDQALAPKRLVMHVVIGVPSESRSRSWWRRLNAPRIASARVTTEPAQDHRPAHGDSRLGSLQPVAEVLQRARLRWRQGPVLEWRRAELADALGRIAYGEDSRPLDSARRGKGRDRGEVVVDGGRRQVLPDERLLPGQAVSAQPGRS
jgi:hypothetical protein